MIETMRWFGQRDAVTLADIRQAGCKGVVTALHQIPVGELWTVKAIKERQNMVAQQNLSWEVVESLPVHEDIKKGLPRRDHWIELYRQSLQHLAACGIKTVCYNFMPVLDWSRTDVDYSLPNGVKTLRYDWYDFMIFDLYLLKRPHAEDDYSPQDYAVAAARYREMSAGELKKLQQTVLLGLPGSDEAFDLHTFQRLLDEYREVDYHALRSHLHYFIQHIGPVAQSCGLNLCIHPDDPPWPLLGLPRVVSTEEDLAGLMGAFPDRCNGITFCTGSLGVREDNHLVRMIQRFADRIHFVHLRATKREDHPRIFYEAEHLSGDVDMYQVVKVLLLEEQRRQRAGLSDAHLPFRPDHGHQMLDDLSKKTYPGYSAIGRIKGLAELRGLIRGIAPSLRA